MMLWVERLAMISRMLLKWRLKISALRQLLLAELPVKLMLKNFWEASFRPFVLENRQKRGITAFVNGNFLKMGKA